MKIALTVNHKSKNTRFYLDSATGIHICYNRSFFNIYKEKNLPLVHIANHIELNIVGKSMVTFDVLVDGKSKVINFYNLFHILELEYNLFLVGTIKTANYLILAKKIDSL